MKKTLDFIRSAPLLSITMALLITFGVLTVVLPKRTFSELENRPLATLDASPLESGFDKAIESWISDHFPGRDAWVKAHAAATSLTGRVRQSGTLLGDGGRLMEEPVREVTATARMAAATVSEIAETLGLPMTAVIIPTSMEACGDEAPTLYDTGDQAAVIRQIYALMPDVQCVTPPLNLPEHYYRTDHHLTAAGAWQVYFALCIEWGFTPIVAERVTVEGMRGSYYARLPSPLIAEESLTVDVPDGLTLVIDGEEAPFINPEKLDGRNKYAALLRETYSQATFTGGTGDETLLIIADSYANAIVPLLSQHFARVDVIDPRYFSSVLADAAQEAASTRILTLMGLNTFSTNRGLMLLTIKEE